MVGTQFHPELRSRPDRPHPLFKELVRVARERSGLLAIQSEPAVAS